MMTMVDFHRMYLLLVNKLYSGFMQDVTTGRLCKFGGICDRYNVHPVCFPKQFLTAKKDKLKLGYEKF